MDNVQDPLTQLDALFNPESVAVVGVPRGMKAGRMLLTALLDQGFPGQIFPVNPKAEEIDGLKAYPSISAIPGPVDLAIVLVPHYHTLSVITECAVKGVKGVVLFTAGYKETGTIEGKALEEDLVRVARSSGMRLIGPNCVGFYSPKTGLSFLPQLSKEPGPVGLISHSGSLAQILSRMGSQRGIRFSKAISLGNECDLTTTDFLTYLAEDSETRLIGVYMEGIKTGHTFLEALKKASLEKPVILWKVGLTPEGSRAAASHTGALASSRQIWMGAVRQGGAVPVAEFEAWVDTIMGFSFLSEKSLGDRLAIISGPGGLAVSAAEACGIAGLRLALLSPSTQSSLSSFIAKTGTSLRNPIDIGLIGAMDKETIFQATRTAAIDEEVDAVVVIGTGMTPEDGQLHAEAMVQIQAESHKPIVMVTVPGFDLGQAHLFYQAEIPVFETVERAMQVYARVREYQRWRQITA
jgi:acyl-CoA synthetase (NDP forming)